MNKKIIFLVTMALAAGFAGMAAKAEDVLAQQFQNPPSWARPAVFGFTFGEASDAVITCDLEQMKAKGITACLIYSLSSQAGTIKRRGKLLYGETTNRIETTKEYDGPGAIPDELGPGYPTWSDEWGKTMRHAAKEARRLGLEFGISMGAIGCDLQDLPAEFAEQALVYSSTAIKGPGPVDVLVPHSTKVPLKADKTPRFYRDIVLLALPASGVVRPEQVIDLSSRMDAAGRLRWDAPAGDWVLLRFGQSVTPKARVIDHLSAEALNQKWEASMGKLLKEMTPEERQGITFVECDSYEGGAQTWTAKFPQEFLQRRGYEIKFWLPVLAGRVIDDTDRSARFQRDYRLTISDLYADNHYARHTALAHTNGLKFYAEAAGPHQKQTDMLKSLSRCDVSMGEFWMPGTHRGVGDERRFLLRDAAAAAHGYGMKDVFCEAFTGGNDPWRESPFYMKPCADQAFCDGLTRPCIHGYDISPWMEDSPGFVYWAGTYFNRHTTWWEQSSAFLDYLARCSSLLRQGVFSPDVAFYDGDGIGKEVSRKAALGDLAGLYDYDRINTEILLTRMSVKDERIILPDGLSYRVLVLSGNEPLPVEVLRKLSALVEAGATIIGARPPGPYGLMDDAAEFKTLADRLWGSVQTEPAAVRQLGKGRVVWGKPVLQFLREDGVPPDVECTGVSAKGIIDWIHRRADASEIYFVANRWQPVEQVECAFRVTGKIPELWDPVTGEIREAGNFRQENGRIILPLKCNPFGSVFVIFRKPTTEATRLGKNWVEFQPTQEIAGPWKVNFDSKWGGPPEAAFATLEDWTKRSESGIKYY